MREAAARLQSLADRLEGYVRQLEAQGAGAAALAAPNETVARPQPPRGAFDSITDPDSAAPADA